MEGIQIHLAIAPIVLIHSGAIALVTSGLPHLIAFITKRSPLYSFSPT
ncbi:MAG: hypothetical protein AAGD25_17980 [Cyanobacteria bacterium P01_F01_bin.150]